MPVVANGVFASEKAVPPADPLYKVFAASATVWPAKSAAVSDGSTGLAKSCKLLSSQPLGFWAEMPTHL